MTNFSCSSSSSQSFLASPSATLKQIVAMTDHDAPGIYEPSTIEEINRLACKALRLPQTSAYRWSHNQPQKPTDSSVYETPSLTEQALEMLSGDFSYDNVAAAKQILKTIIGEKS